MKLEYKVALSFLATATALLVIVLLVKMFSKRDETLSTKSSQKTQTSGGKEPTSNGEVTRQVTDQGGKGKNDGLNNGKAENVNNQQQQVVDSSNKQQEKDKNKDVDGLKVKDGKGKKVAQQDVDSTKKQPETVVQNGTKITETGGIVLQLNEQPFSPDFIISKDEPKDPETVRLEQEREEAVKKSFKSQNDFLLQCPSFHTDTKYATPFKEPPACCAAQLQADSGRFIRSPTEVATPEFIDRLHGMAWAAFAGDAFGAAVEFLKPADVLHLFPPTRTPIDYDESRWDPFWKGLWTDDSTAALCLASAYIKSRFLDCKTHFETLRRWPSPEKYMHVVNDVGPSTRKALENNQISSASTTNGCIMRMWPNPFFYALHPIEDAIDASAASATLTHAHTICRDSSRLMAAIIWELLHGASKEEVLSPNFKQRHPTIWAERPFATTPGKNVADLLEDPSSANFPAGLQNYEVEEALKVALEAFRETDNLLDGFLYCVRKGADTDTTATIYGQMAGAYYGKKHIMDKFPWMIERLYAKPALEQLIYAMTILAQDHFAELPKMSIFDADGNVVSFNMNHLSDELKCSAYPPYWKA